MKNFCFVLIAERDYTFFTKVAKELVDSGHKVTLLSFHTPHKLRKNLEKLKIIYFQDLINQFNPSIKTNGGFEEKWIIHERVTYDIKEVELSKKFKLYEETAKIFLKFNKFDFIIQELGGFVAPMSLYKACIASGVQHLFIEPTFLRGHLGFILNDLSYNVEKLDLPKSSFDAESFIRETISSKPRVVPKKDMHHFLDASLKKFINKSNFMSLLKKLFHRYVLFYDFEYKYSAVFLRRAAQSLINRRFLSKHYLNMHYVKELSTNRKCYFYPFHVKFDFSLTVRSPNNLDQICVINEICNVIGKQGVLFVKEHPASTGAYGKKDLKQLAYPDRVAWIKPSEKTFDVIKYCKAVFTINSKVGVEALIMGIPVFCIGDSYYRGDGLAVGIEHFSRESKMDKAPSHGELLSFLKKLHFVSFECELYQSDSDNISKFSQALVVATSEERYLNA